MLLRRCRRRKVIVCTGGKWEFVKASSGGGRYVEVNSKEGGRELAVDGGGEKVRMAMGTRSPQTRWVPALNGEGLV